METIGEDYEFSDFQLKWLEALESGEFKQGKNYLKQIVDGEPHYCCLGIGCQLLKLEEVKPESGSDDIVAFVDSKVESNTSTAGERLMKVLKIRDAVGSMTNNSSLASMNDNNVSFKDIAKFCRENPEKVFKE